MSLLAAGSSAWGGEGGGYDAASALARSLVSPGDTARLQRVLAKARRGEKITIGVIGGSITQGAAASKAAMRYGDRVTKWWKETFPNAKVSFVNAGIGATGSNYGALRAARDLLADRPDFVVVEYGVNDGNEQSCAETVEGLVRQILTQPNQPAVMLFFMMHQNGGNAQEWHDKVGKHYDLPMVSLRDALWPEIQAGRMKWEDIEADLVHPNDRGHELTATFITTYLEKILRELPADDRLPPNKPLSPALMGDLFERVALYEAEGLKPVANKGWTLDSNLHCWKSETPGSVLEFEIEGQVLLMMEFHIRGPMGKARIQVDNQPPIVRDAWFDQTWGGYRQTNEIFRGKELGKHRVRIELLEEKHAESTGHEFRLLGIGAAGVRR
jgi:lysophospholipase L1-like esterase